MFHVQYPIGKLIYNVEIKSFLWFSHQFSKMCVGHLNYLKQIKIYFIFYKKIDKHEIKIDSLQNPFMYSK